MGLASRRGYFVPFFVSAPACATLRTRTTGRCPWTGRSCRCPERRSSPRAPVLAMPIASSISAIEIVNHRADDRRCPRRRAVLRSSFAAMIRTPLRGVLPLTRRVAILPSPWRESFPLQEPGLSRPSVPLGRCTGRRPRTYRNLLTNLVFPLTQMAGRRLERWEFKGLVGPPRDLPRHSKTHRAYPL